MIMEVASLMQAIDMGDVRGVMTAVTMAAFGGIVWWAYRRGNRERFEADAMLPFADEPEHREDGR